LDQSPHSDSGRSVEDGSIILGQTSMTPLLPVLKGTSQIRIWPDIPKPKHSTILPATLNLPWTPSPSVQQHLNDDTSSPYAFCYSPDIPSSPPSLSGYRNVATGLANECSSASSLPLKAFSQTCEELLLGLQCDVAELDNELKRLDACSEQLKDTDGETANPTGCRGSWQLAQYQADLAACKVDVSARLHPKLEQYCS
jgi:hypothetical protein